MRVFVVIFFVVIELSAKSQALTFTVNSASFIFSITCVNPQVTLVATSNYSSPVNYAWTGTNFSASGPTITLNNPGNYMVVASSGTLSTTQTISIATNTVFPICIASSTFQVNNATVTAVPFTWTVTNLTNNLLHHTYYPVSTGLPPYVNGGVVSIFSAGPPGTYTHCVISTENGCATCAPFILSPTSPVIPNTGTGVKEYSSEKTFVFPNPNNGIFKIDNKNIPIKNIEVYNSLGALVHAVQWADDRDFVNIQNEPSGIYVVKIIELNGRSSFLKMIRE